MKPGDAFRDLAAELRAAHEAVIATPTDTRKGRELARVVGKVLGTLDVAATRLDHEAERVH